MTTPQLQAPGVVLRPLELSDAPALFAANWPDHPSLRAVRVSAPPVIDGDLSDPAWQSAPEFTDFTQHDPVDGQPATMRTSVRIVYDEHPIYFGAARPIDGSVRALALKKKLGGIAWRAGSGRGATLRVRVEIRLTVGVPRTWRASRRSNARCCARRWRPYGSEEWSATRPARRISPRPGWSSRTC